MVLIYYCICGFNVIICSKIIKGDFDNGKDNIYTVAKRR